MSTGAKRALNIIFKTAFAVLLGWMLYRHATTGIEAFDWQRLWDPERFRSRAHWLVAAAAFISINWALETLKWQCFLRAYATVPFWRAYAAVLSGVAVSLFTPNRIGEYGGRILSMEPGAAWGVVVSSLLGSFCQWIVLLTGGVLGAYAVASSITEVEPLLLKSFLMLGLGLAAVLLFALFNVRLAALAVRRIPGLKTRSRWMRRLVALRRYDNKTIMAALGWAALRYVVYCFQYYLLLRFFGIAVPPGEAAAGIAAIFLAQTSLPLPPLAALLARGELALAVWGRFSPDTGAVLAAVYSLFILNLSLPSLVGALFILQTNLAKFWKNENKNLANKRFDRSSDPLDRL
ncbi:MAG: flippase-like domain-containing protein [Saprospiraceae bacterium]|nr:flippase-like domain-containing protein [Saprospiraceae bacterium]